MTRHLYRLPIASAASQAPPELLEILRTCDECSRECRVRGMFLVADEPLRGLFCSKVCLRKHVPNSVVVHRG